MTEPAHSDEKAVNGAKPEAVSSPPNDVHNTVSSNQPNGDGSPQLDPAVLEQAVKVRAHIHETFGKVAIAMMALPRYRHLSVIDLRHVLLEPLMRDRVAIASSIPTTSKTPALDTLSGIAIWASVSEDVDAKIREQIKAGVFPVRLSPNEWTSGSINWLFDVIAPNQKLTTSVIANFKQVIKEGDLRIHPLITKLVDAETLKKMGAAPVPKQ